MLEEVHDPIAERLRLATPVDAAAQMRHRDEHVQALAAGRGHARVRFGRRVQVQAHIRWQTLAVEDVVDQAAIAGGHDDRVVQQLRILAIQPQVEQEAAHGVAIAAHAPVSHLAAIAGRYQAHVGRRDVGVEYDSVSSE